MVVRTTVKVLASALALSVLVMLGWGVRHLGSFFVSPPRAAFLAIMLVAMACATASAQNPTKLGRRTPAVPWQRVVLASVQIVTLPLLFFLPYGDEREIMVFHAEWVRWFGLGTALAGYGVMLAALRALGRNYSVYVTIQDEHQLVQTGIYKRVRHPIYLGLMMSWPGACLVFRSWLVFPVFLYFVAFGVWRGAQEERVLSEEFKNEFEEYRERSWRLLPCIY